MKIKNICNGVLVGTLSLLVISDANALTCFVSKSNVCSEGQCRQIESPKSRTIIDRDQLLRCDEKGCDKYTVVTAKSGNYTNVQIPGTSYIFKYDQELNFLEVASIGILLVIHTGKCN